MTDDRLQMEDFFFKVLFNCKLTVIVNRVLQILNSNDIQQQSPEIKIKIVVPLTQTCISFCPKKAKVLFF